MKKLLFVLFVINGFSSCVSHPEEVRDVLELAKSNRTELEKVIEKLPGVP